MEQPGAPAEAQGGAPAAPEQEAAGHDDQGRSGRGGGDAQGWRTKGELSKHLPDQHMHPERH